MRQMIAVRRKNEGEEVKSDDGKEKEDERRSYK